MKADTAWHCADWHRAACALRAGALLALLLTALAAPAQAQTRPEATRPEEVRTEGARLVLSEPALWDYAETLLAQREYFRAISEYQRLIYFFPEGVHRPLAERRIGEAYVLGGEPAQAVRHFSALLARPAGAVPAAEVDALHYLRAVARLEEHGDQPYPRRQASIRAAVEDLAALSPGWPDRGRTEGFAQALAAPPALPQRSPWLAGGLSAVIPGTGSFYVGRYAEGSLTFFLELLLISGAANAFQTHQEGLGTALGALALAFYGGGIYAAANGAHKFNDQAQAAYLEQQRVRFGLILEPGQVAGSFRVGF